MQCKNCMKFKGDCGHHFRDEQGHIVYDCPSESCCDRYGKCDYYEEKRNKYQKIQGTDERICMLLKPTGKYCGVTVAYKIGETAYICPIIK